MTKNISIKLSILFLTLFCNFSLFKNCSCENSLVHSNHTNHNINKESISYPKGFHPINIEPTRLQLYGITTQIIKNRNLVRNIRTVGVVKVDETRIKKIQTKFSGWIEKLFVNFTGMPIKSGDPLFEVYSAELLATEEEFLLALKNVDEFKHFGAGLLDAAQKRLSLWDVPQDEIMRLKQTRTPSKTLLIRSPYTGIVLEKIAFTGMNVEPGMNLFSIADLSSVWVLADIYENDISIIKLGQKASANFASIPSQNFQGSVVFYDYVLGTDTRTAQVRIECENRKMILKPEMYGTVQIKIPIGTSLALPEEALIDTGKRKIVFVAKGEGRFEPREIKLGLKANNYYQILSGLNEGEEVVTSSQFLLDSESRMGSSGSMTGHSAH